MLRIHRRPGRRSHMMEDIRSLVSSFYGFKNTKNSQIKVRQLLNNGVFLAKEIDDKVDPGNRGLSWLTRVQGNYRGPFISPIIIRAFARTFFETERSRNTLGTLSLTRHMFDPITCETILYVCAMIRHCIREYEFGSRIVRKFEGLNLEGKYVKSSEVRR